jgi:GMP synthase-like glutamine amidotransferase
VTDGGGRLLVVHHEDDAGLGRLRPVLAAAVELDEVHPWRGDALPALLDGYAGLVVLGGAMGAMDDDVAPWLPATRRLMAAGVEHDLPTLGICLGAQLLAAATGGRVARGAAGLEVGVVPVTLAAAATDDVLLGPVVRRLGATLEVPQFHQDAVTELPPGAVLLASGERYPHQAFRLGGRAWGLQYHPEVTGEDWAAWLRDGHGSVQAAGMDSSDLATGYAAVEPALVELADAHADAFAGILAGTPSRRDHADLS